MNNDIDYTFLSSPTIKQQKTLLQKKTTASLGGAVHYKIGCFATSILHFVLRNSKLFYENNTCLERIFF